MLWQIREYQLKSEAAEEFIDVWKNYVVPFREELGFVVRGGWLAEDGRGFVWIIGHEAPNGWDAEEKAYFEHLARSSWPANPASFVERSDARLFTEV